MSNMDTVKLSLATLLIIIPNLVFGGQSVIEEDKERIRKHLKEVEAKLRAKDVSALSTEQRRAREANLDLLRKYWKRGTFPHNTMVDGRTPVFIDGDGRKCAVGYLMAKSGWETEAKEIAREENLKRLPNMNSPEVGAWLAHSGLTAKEATMIQPSYSYRRCRDKCNCDVDPVCGSNGETYINECVARKCLGLEKINEGCCSLSDQPNDSALSCDSASTSERSRDAGQTDAGRGDVNASSGSVCQNSEKALVPEAEAPADAGCGGCSASGDDSTASFFSLLCIFVAGLFGIRRWRD